MFSHFWRLKVQNKDINGATCSLIALADNPFNDFPQFLVLLAVPDTPWLVVTPL